MQQTIFNLKGADSYTKAKSTIGGITERLEKKVKLDRMELLSWADNTITYHGYTKITKRSVLLKVTQDGTIYAIMEGEDVELAVGTIH